MEIPKLRLLNEYCGKTNFDVLASNDNLHVFRYDGPQGARVQKHVKEAYRPEEYRGAQLWYPFLGFEVQVKSTDITQSEGTPKFYTIVDMPWLGHELLYLPDQIDPTSLAPQIYPPFLGLTRERASHLLGRTKSLLDEFYRQTGLLHVDLWLDDEPINITYHPSLDYFPPIDAASFEEPGSIDDTFRFERAFQNICDYVMENLVID